MTDATGLGPAERGGGFLVGPPDPGAVFTPEDFSPEHRMIARTAREFVAGEVLPHHDRIEAKDLAFTVGLLRKAGELGLLMADIPAAYGGLGLDKAASALVVENIAGQGSFQVFHLVQTGIGSLPVVYYGTEAQKRRYLPGLADGSVLGCYGLTEPSAGSDALACRTRATLSPDGRHYVLEGTKQFITSARIADVLIVFAKVDGERFTAFLVDAGSPGLSFGPDEHKMGIRGTTTCTVILQGVRVPADNVLGEVGQGHKIAFNILNIGRFKLGALAVGMCKRALEHALAYCLERRQFGRRIAEFGAIREKLAEMYARTYALEAAVYRTVGLIDRLLAAAGDDHGAAALRSIEEYSVECSLVKVLGSETLDYVVDETVQCYGGYGYCAEYPAEAFYRDSRINRIYEGTNEINRLLVPTMLLRKAGRGELDLVPAGPSPAGSGPLAGELDRVGRLKAVAVRLLARARDRWGDGLAGHQAVQLRLADLVLLAYAAESAVVRAARDAARRGPEGAALAVTAARITCETAVDRSHSLARQVLVAAGDRDGLAALDGWLGREPVDLLALREAVAAELVARERAY